MREDLDTNRSEDVNPLRRRLARVARQYLFPILLWVLVGLTMTLSIHLIRSPLPPIIVPVETPTPYLSPVPPIIPRPGYVVGRPTSPWGPIPEYKVILYGPIESDKPLEIPFEASDYGTFEFPIQEYGTYIVSFVEPETDTRICEYELILGPLESAVIGCESGVWLAPWTDYRPE